MNHKNHIPEELFACPECQGKLSVTETSHKIICKCCNANFSICESIPVFYPVDNQEVATLEDAHWSSLSNDHQNLYENMPDESYQFFINKFSLESNTTGLEIGCGDGPFSRRLHTTNNYGIDVSLPLLKISHNMVAVQGNALRLPFKNNVFDWIIYAYSLHHMPDTQIAITEAVRVLKPGGKIFFIDPNLYHPIRYLTREPKCFFRKFFFKYLTPEEHWVSARSVVLELKKCGLKECEHEYLTPSFNSKTLIGFVQKTISSLVGKSFLSPFVNSYFYIRAQK